MWFISELDTEDTGAITKANAISALQNSGEGSYDQVREVLKHVSIDASGKVELEDWVEVYCIRFRVPWARAKLYDEGSWLPSYGRLGRVQFCRPRLAKSLFKAQTRT